MSESVVELIVALVKAGIEEVPVIVDAIQRALRHEDPLAGLASERVADIVARGLQLPIMLAAAKVQA